MEKFKPHSLKRKEKRLRRKLWIRLDSGAKRERWLHGYVTKLKPISRQSSFQSSLTTVHCDSLYILFRCICMCFVGEYDSVTGCLMPQQFFSRWIYPGLLLHIAVNPALCEIK
jgi:hypothetical protein